MHAPNPLSSNLYYQYITALKKGATLLKYGRRGKPKFCPFRLSQDEMELIYHLGKDEKYLKLSTVTALSTGQKTAVFQRHLRPHQAHLSFSLIHSGGERSLDLVRGLSLVRQDEFCTF